VALKWVVLITGWTGLHYVPFAFHAEWLGAHIDKGIGEG
jgi:hypothetical protein